MGRRKERRLAAISAAGRRVKLDLCVEPSGDLGGSSAQEELGEDSDSRTQAELPDSPSSSGPQLNNPLMLLEQYSDDDVDELLSEGPDPGAAKDPTDDLDDTKKVIGEVTTEDIGTNDVNDPSVQLVKQLEMDNDSVSQDLFQKHGKGGTSLSYTDDLHRETKAIEEGICAARPDGQVGDLSSSWKKVLHDESSQYYYWNILTGETSWEVPNVLAQATVLNHPEKAVGDTSGISVAVEQEDATFEKLNEGSEAIYKTSGNSSKGAEADGFEEGSKGDSLGNEIGNTAACQNCRTSLLDEAPVVNDAKYNCNLLSGDCKSGTDFSSHLVKHCDILLEQLNSLESLNWNLQFQDIKLKYKLEVEIRLSDIKALASHGSTLLQFWLHTEDQLKRLDASIDDVIRQYGSAPIGEYEATVKSQEAYKVDSNEKNGPCQAANESNHPDCTPEMSHIEAYSDLATTTGLVSSVVNPITCSNTETEGKDEVIGLEVQSEIISKSVHYCGEEVDMDVDMEVEDTSTSLKSSIEGTSGAHYHIPSHERSNLQHPSAVHEPLLQGQMFSVQPPATSWIHQLSIENEPCPPPAPDNEPFPPPPPDDYPFPPPPPDESPETSYPPPSHLECVHSLPYSEHYVLTYPSSNLDYYGQSNTEISGATLYAHLEGVQVSASHITPYYEAVSNVYAVAPLVGNPGEPSSYYGLQNGSLNPPSVSGAAVESSRIQSETVLTNRETDATCSLDSHAGYDLFPKANPSVVKSGQGSVKEPEFLDAQPAIESQSTTFMSHGANASSASDAPTFVSAAAASSKVQSKVSRSKKRTIAMGSTLRSNKKVSSLVDKWKAAKEELHEEEEEPENTYEMSERKRQREIEKWQAQQIASGEAKDNANFQPLGGDWRERVKRKRAQKMKETEHNVSKPTGPEEPNLVELSRDLPSGWQAYWDDSSKKVYYGNVVTSETTWNEPKH